MINDSQMQITLNKRLTSSYWNKNVCHISTDIHKTGIVIAFPYDPIKYVDNFTSLLSPTLQS